MSANAAFTYGAELDVKYEALFSLAYSVPFTIPGRVFINSNPNVVFESRQRQLRGTAWVVLDKPPEFFDLLLNILSGAPLLWV